MFSTSARATGASGSAPSATTASRTTWSAQACPTDSIQFGELDELRERAEERVEKLHDRGIGEARLYGHDTDDGVGGFGAFFLLLDEPETYRLPPDPVATTRHLGENWKASVVAALTLTGAVLASFLGGRR